MRRSGRHSRARERAAAGQAGITLIELLVVLAVLGALMLVGYMALRDVTKAALRETATELTAVLKASHNMATMSRQHHRVVFDLEEQTFRIEMCEGEVLLKRSDKEAEPVDPEKLAEEIPAIEDLMRGTNLPADVIKSIGGANPAGIAAAVAGKEMPSTCGISPLSTDDADGRGNARKIRTDDGVRVSRVYVQHLEDVQLDGMVTVNFFPLGYAEKAVVELADNDGDVFKVVVHGLTGRVELQDRDFDSEEFMSRNAVGDREEAR